MSYEIDLDDPFGSLVEQADRFLSGQKDTLIHTFAQTLGQILRPSAPSPQGDQRPRGSGPHRAKARGGFGNGDEKTHSRAPSSAPVSNPREILGFDEKTKLTRSMVKERQKILAKLWHPDAGGNLKAMQKLNSAVAELLKNI